MRPLLVSLFYVLLSLIYTSQAQNFFQLNPGYGQGNGYAGFGASIWATSRAYAAARQSDGKFIVVGYAQSTNSSPVQISLVRFKENGDLDTTFANNGYATLNMAPVSGNNVNAQARCIAIDNADRIIVAGYAYNSPAMDQPNLIIARFLANGTPDASFGIQGSTGITGTMPITTQLTGYTGTVAGSSNGSGGSLGYITFMLNNQFIAYGVAVQPDNKIVVVGQTNLNTMIAARFLSNGALDTTANGGTGFGYGNSTGQGTAILGYIVGNNLGSGAFCGYALTILANGKILINGLNSTDNGQMMLLRLTTEGQLDKNFNTPYGYIVTTNTSNNFSQANVIKVQANQDIIIAGYTTMSGEIQSAISARYNENGTLKTAYGNGNGYVVTNIPNYSTISISGITYNQNDQIFLIGYVQENSGSPISIIISYNQDGSLNTDFSSTGYMLLSENIPSNSATTITFREDGTLLVGANIQGLGLGAINLFGQGLPLAIPYIQIYGYNPDLFTNFLYISTYAQIITDNNARQATIQAVNQVLKDYTTTYSVEKNFNFISYLYLLHTTLQEAQATLIENYPDDAVSINTFFDNLTERLLRLTLQT